MEGLALALLGALVIGQVTAGGALERLGIIQPGSGLFGGIGSTIAGLGAGLGTEIGKTGFP